MKIYSKVGIIILACVMVFGGSIVPTRAATNPVFNYVSFSSPVATVGDTITIYASYTPSTGATAMSYGYAELVLADGSYYSWIYLNYNSNTGNLEGSYFVNQYAPSILYIGEVYAYDTNGYSTFNYNGTSFTNIGINLTGTIPDTTAPSLISVQFDRSTANVGDTVNIYVTATDDASGINYIEIDLYDSNGYFTYFSTNNNSNSLSQTVTLSFTVNKFWDSAIYIGAVYLTDYAGNTGSFYNTTNYPTPILTLTGTTYDSQPPVLNWIQFSQSVAYPGDNVTITVNASDDASGVQSVYFTLAENQANSYLYLSAYNTSDALTQSFVTSIIISQYAPVSLYVSYIQINDYAGRGSNYSNGTDYTSPILQISGSTPDSTPPAFQSVWFDTSFATWGSTVNVYVQASDAVSGVQSIYVDLLDLNNYYLYSSIYLNYNTQTGYWQGSVYISSYSPSLISVYAVELYDNAGNYYQAMNGSDFTSPLLSTAPIQPNTIQVSLTPNYAKSYVGSTVNFKANVSSNFDHSMTAKLVLNGTDGAGNSKTFYYSQIGVDTWQNNVPYQLINFSVAFNTPGTITGTITVYDDLNVAWSAPFSWTVMSLSNNNQSSNPSSNNNESILPSIHLPLPALTFNITVISMLGLIVINRRRIKK